MAEKPYTIAKLDDGNLEVKFETGEVFSGDPLEVTAKLADSRIYARQERDQWRQKFETAPPPPPPPAPADANEKQLQEYMATQQAKFLGLGTAQELKDKFAYIDKAVAEVSQANALTQFFTQHPEYPGTQEANDSIGKIMEEMGWELNARNLHLAHLEALDRHQKDPKQYYEPLSEQAIAEGRGNGQDSRRANAPPMLRSGNPETSQGANFDPYSRDLPMDKLRQMAIQEQLSPRK